MQLIHWFTSSKQSGNEERDALLDSVYVSIYGKGKEAKQEIPREEREVLRDTLECA